ncbi:MAG TPA: DUF2586 family protein [Chitinophagales bacterium]|nr:DUF2586 family protein [Chitinophagales bacterium]
MGQPQINIYRREGGLGRVGDNERNWSALCMNGVAVTDLVDLNTVYELNNVNDAVALGLDAAYDTSNLMLVHYHIKEFFRMCPTGKLFIMLVSQTVTLTQMADLATTYGLAKLLRDPLCEGKVRQAAIALNPEANYTPTYADDIDDDCLKVTGSTYGGAVVKAQALAEEERVLKRPVHIFVEGRLDPDMASNTLIEAVEAASPKVQLVALQDYDVANTDSTFENHAAVGTVLGYRANIGLSPSLANPAQGSIQNGATGDFVNPALSSHKVLTHYSDTLNGDMDVIYDKGFIIPRVHQNYPGVYLNSDRTCVDTTNDYARGSNNMVANEAERIIYNYFVPKLDADVKVDKNTGKLAPVVVNAWQAGVTQVLKAGLEGSDQDNSGDVSSVEAYINPNQNFLSTDTISVEAEIVPKGYAKTIKVYVGFKNPFKK